MTTMDIKKWAGSRLGFGNVVPVPTDPTGPVMPPQGPPRVGGMYGAPGAKALFNAAITSDDLPPTMAQWAKTGGTAPEHPGGPVPPWAADQAAFQHAVALVKKHWEEYEEPWAVVGLAYDAMASAQKPAGPPGMPPKPPAAAAPPMGAPKPPGPPGGAPKPNPFAPGGAKPNPFGA